MKMKKEILIFCMIGSGLFAAPSESANDSRGHYQSEGSGSTVIVEEGAPAPVEGPYWIGPGLYDGVWFDYPEDYYNNYYYTHGYRDEDGNWHERQDGQWQRDHGHESGFEEAPHEEGGYRGGGGRH